MQTVTTRAALPRQRDNKDITPAIMARPTYGHGAIDRSHYCLLTLQRTLRTKNFDKRNKPIQTLLQHMPFHLPFHRFSNPKITSPSTIVGCACDSSCQTRLRGIQSIWVLRGRLRSSRQIPPSVQSNQVTQRRIQNPQHRFIIRAV